MSREYVRRFVADVSKFMKQPIPQEPDEKMEQAKEVLETAKEMSKIKKKTRKKKKE